MSSPNDNQGPPPPGHPVEQTPPPAPPADAAPDATANANSNSNTSGTENGTQPTPTPAPGTPGRQRRRPLSSVAFFVPFPRGTRLGPEPAEGEEDTRAGVAWTFEVFPSDADANEGENDNGSGGEDAGNGNGNGNEQGQRVDGPPPAADGENQQDDGARPNAAGAQRGRDTQTFEHTAFFIIGPDGQLVPQAGPGGGAGGGAGGGGGGNGNNGAGGGTNFWFPFTLPFVFAQPGPPAPDPAKAAELLASLPTIGRALLRRVDKIITAEDAFGGKEYDDRGWRCGICLEGLDLDTTDPDKPHPVKGLPCNHLFHEECLQPWFTSHHTCPTCRLDLDPLRTLHGPRETRGNPLRPTATGSGRATPRNAPHPYARDREARDRPRSGLQTPANPPTETLATPAEATPAPDNQQETQQNQNLNAAAREGDARPARPQGLPGLHEIMTTLLQQATAAVFGELAQGQGRMFDNPITASPAPMDRPATAPGSTPREREDTPSPSPSDAPPPAQEAQGAEAPAAAAEQPAEQDEHEPMAQDEPEQAQAEQIQSEQAQAEPTQSEQAQPEQTQPEPAQPEPRRPIPERRTHFHFFNIGGPPAAARPATPAAAPAAGTPAAATPAPDAAPGSARAANAERANEARTFANLLNDIPIEFRFLRPPGMVQPPTPAPPAPPRETATPSAPAFVPQSLSSWTEQREKGLGWRCDAVECLVAAPVPDESAEEMDIDEEEPVPASDKEMLSIYAELQAPFKPAGPGEDAHSNMDFVLLACPHRWHRTCLETAERSAGHRALPDDDGREWVHCQKCRKAGWVTPRVEEVVPDVPNVAA